MFYDFRATSFKNFVWLKSGGLFKNPGELDIEMINSGAYGVEVFRTDGTLAGKSTRSNEHGGWATFYFRNGGDFGGVVIPNGEYKIKLVNLALGRRDVKSGQLRYNE